MDYPEWLDPDKGAAMDKGGSALVNAAHRTAASAAMDDFKKHRIPVRFQGRGSRELGWEQRSPFYDRSKAKRGKLGKDHNYSGSTFSRFRAARVKATKTGGKVSVSGLGVQYRRGFRAGLRNIPMRDEISEVSNAELLRMSKIYRREFVRFLTTNPKAQRRRKKMIR